MSALKAARLGFLGIGSWDQKPLEKPLVMRVVVVFSKFADYTSGVEASGNQLP